MLSWPAEVEDCKGHIVSATTEKNSKRVKKPSQEGKKPQNTKRHNQRVVKQKMQTKTPSVLTAINLLYGNVCHSEQLPRFTFSNTSEIDVDLVIIPNQPKPKMVAMEILNRKDAI